MHGFQMYEAPLNFVSPPCHFVPTVFLMGELWSFIPNHVRVKLLLQWCPTAWHTADSYTLAHIWPLKENLNCWRVIFWPLLFVFWQCQQCVADKVAPLSQPTKIWNWRITVSPNRVAVLSIAILRHFSIPLTLATLQEMFLHCRCKDFL